MKLWRCNCKQFIVALALSLLFSFSAAAAADPAGAAKQDSVTALKHLRILLLQDEILTNSVTSYVYSQEAQWSQRYQLAMKTFDEAWAGLRQSCLKAGVGDQELAEFEAAAARLYEIEADVFAAIESGRPEQARQLLHSADYLAQKDRLAASLDRLAVKMELNLVKTAAPGSRHDSEVSFTAQEHAWMQQNPVIVFGADPDWPPFESIDASGIHVGIIDDYLKAVEDKTGLKFKLHPRRSWAEIYQAAKDREVDILPALMSNEERRKDFLFTKPYLRVPCAVLTRLELEDLADLTSLGNRSLGVVRGYAAETWLRANYPSIEPVLVDSISEGLKRVEAGELDAMFANQYSALDLMAELGLNAIKVNLLSEFTYEIAIGVRKDWPQLVSILDRALDSITPVQRREIRARWLKLDLDSDAASRSQIPAEYRRIVQLGIGTLLFAVLFLFVVYQLGRMHEKRGLESESESSRFAAAFGVLGLLSLVIVTTWYALAAERNIALKRAGDSLNSLLLTRHEVLKDWLDKSQEMLLLLSRTTELSDNLRELGSAVSAEQKLTMMRAMQASLPGHQFWELALLLPDKSVIYAQDLNRFPIPSELVTTTLNGQAGIALPEKTPGQSADSRARILFSAPIYDDSGDLLGALIGAKDARSEFSGIFRLGQIGQSGETYAFNRDGYVLSETRFTDELVAKGLLDEGQNPILNLRLMVPGGSSSQLTYMASQATRGKNGVSLKGHPDYLGIPVLSAWRWDEGLELGIATEVAVSDALSAYRLSRNTLIAVVSVAVFMAFGLMWIANSMSSRANRVILRSRDLLEKRVQQRTAELSRSERKLQSVLDHSPALIFAKDLQGRYFLVNHIWSKISGVSAADAKGHTDFELFSRKVAQQFSENDQHVIRSGKLLQCEEELVTDGVTRTFLSYKFPLFNENGELYAVCGISQEISDFKTIQNRLKLQQKQLTTILNSSPDPMIIVNESGCITMVNQQTEKAFGYSQAELIGQQVEILIPEHVRSAHPQHRADFVKAASARMMGSGLELYAVNKAGDEFPVEISLSPIEGDDGMQIFAGLRDITERKQAEHRLRQSAEALKALFNTLPVGVVMLDANGVPQQSNQLALEYLGISAEEYRQRGLASPEWKVVRDDLSPMPQDEYPAARVLTGQHSFAQDLLGVYRPQGDLIWLHVSAAKIPDDAGGGAALAIVDVTEKREIDRQLRLAKDVAEEATKTKSDFLANMSHEIRTPMNAIIGMSQLALSTDLNRKQRGYVEKVNRAAESLLGVINDILDFSKVEAGKLALEATPFRLREVFENLASLIGIKAEESHCELIFDLPAELPDDLIGDPLRLGQILLNLTTNALKFTEGGEVIVSVELLDRHSNQVELQFTVVDTGIGLTNEQTDRLFQSFAQADTSTTRKYGGTGLGLTISKSLCELMGGKIWVESESGVGSSFHFTACFECPAAGAEPALLGPEKLGALRVLIVDDNSTAREVLTKLLASFGYRVDTASSGAQAIEMFQAATDENFYELLIVDAQMPDMDGFETVHSIVRSGLDNAVTTIIMLMGYGQSDTQEAAAHSEIDAFLNKPVTSSTLLDVIMDARGFEVAAKRTGNGRGQAEQAIKALNGARVLLVEDNEVNQELACEILQMNGLRVEVANNGQDALDWLARRSFDGVLMDCQMPVMDGYEAVRRIRKNPDFSKLPIIAMTANAMVGDREKVIEAGMNDHISKPINPALMFTTMAKWIRPSAPSESKPALLDRPSQDDSVLELPGIDQDRGLRSAMGNRKLYHKLLSKFAELEKDFVDRFSGALEQRNDADMLRFAHTLKGVAGSIGALAVERRAEELEALCKPPVDHEQIKGPLEQLAPALSEVIEGIERIQVSVANNNDGEIDNQLLLTSLNRLQSLLEEEDTEATDVLDEMLSMDGIGQYSRHLKLLRSDIENYEFEEALINVQAMRRLITA